MTRDPTILPRFVRAAPVLAAAAAAALALPGVRLPFLSDDWHLVASVARWPPPATPYEYVRPLYMGTYWLDRALWGPSPALFHLTNLLLLALCAALVVIVVRRLTGDRAIAGATGLLFALHPYHVENAAWIAVRGDPLYSLFVLASLWAYDRWRANRRAIPFAALACFAAALLAKETAVVLLPLFAVLAVVDPARRPDRAERIRGLAPFAAVATAHLLVVRPLLLAGGPGRSLTPGAGIAWLKHALGFAVAAVVPVDGEILAAHPFLCGGAAALGLGVLVALALLHGRGRLPRFTLAAAAVFAVLLAPSIVGFQERYLYLPAAASCLLLASLLRAQRRAVMIVGTAALVLGWTYGCIRHWENWSEAASASRALVDDLVTASRDPDTQEIVIANVPFRVRGGSVAGDFQSALGLSGGRAIPVHGVAYVSYPSATDDFIAIVDRARGVAPDPSLVTLVVPNRPFSHYVGPLPPSESAYGSVSLVDSDAGSHVSIRLHRAPGRAVFTWTNGRLKRRL